MIDRFIIWLVGKDSYQKSIRSVFDKIGFLTTILNFVVSLTFIIIDSINGFYAPLIPLGIINIGSIIGFVVARAGHLTAAKVIVLVVTNLALFVITCADSYSTGSSLYYITLSLVSFTILGFKHRKVAIALVLLSCILHQVSVLTDFSIIPKFEFTDKQIAARFLFNSSLFIVMTLGIFFLFMSMIYRQQSVIRLQNKELKDTNSELDHFLYSTSHDLRAPLASVQGLLRIAETTQSPDELKQIHGMMYEQVLKMDDFIKDIINIMRNSRQPVQSEKFNLNKFVDDIIDDNKYNSVSGNIKVINDVPESLYINTDIGRLKTVVGNLCSNALKYADKKKDTSYVKVDCKITDSSVIVNVDDNGIGIDPVYKDKVFNMFFRATEESKGTGLGLYIAKETVSNLGGEIHLKSHLGEGTNFQVSLPKEVLAV